MCILHQDVNAMCIMNQDVIIEALDTMTPAEVIRSQKLLRSFRGFLARGSANDFAQLFSHTSINIPAASEVQPVNGTTETAEAPNRPERDAISQYSSVRFRAQPDRSFSSNGKASTSAGSGRTLRTAARTPLSNAASATNEEKSSSDSEAEPQDIETQKSNQKNEVWNFFAARIKAHSRIHGLIRVVEGCVKAAKYSSDFYESLWFANKDVIFSAQTSGESRLSRLYRGRKKIDQFHQKFECASRLSLVFLAHDIEVAKMQNWKLGPGQSRQHAAVLWIAQDLGITSEEIKRDWRRGRNYMKLLEMCGPGSLLELGSGVNWYWEKALAKEDVSHFIDFRKEMMSCLDVRSRELNHVAGRMILNGMLAYGWTHEAISGTSTRLHQALLVHCPGVFAPPNAPPTAPPTMAGSASPETTASQTETFDHANGLVSPSSLVLETRHETDIRCEMDLDGSSQGAEDDFNSADMDFMNDCHEFVTSAGNLEWAQLDSVDAYISHTAGVGDQWIA